MKITRTNKLLAIVLSTLLAAAAVGCKKDNNKSRKADGMILNFGNVEADGCGWVVRIDHVDYSPKNLNNGFKQDSLQVRVSYDLLQTRFQCGIAANIGLSEINIKDISKR